MRPDSIALAKQTNHDVLKHKKKRGKYVEKKASKLSTHSKTSSRARKLTRSPVISPKACSPKRMPSIVPRRPSPTSFVNSVLDILSRTNTKPQYTENSYHRREYKLNADLEDVPEDTIKPKEKKMSNKNRKLEKYPEKTYRSPVNNTPKKKFKSKVLNIERNRPMPREDLVVLQSNKKLDLKPSACSSFSRDGLSWMSYSDDEEVFINKEIITEPPLNIDYENNQVVKEINEGKKLNEEKSKLETSNSEKGPDKAIYNFFVDVLHTIKPDYQIQLKKETQLTDSTDNLKNLEIDENVANKLAFTQKTNKKVNIYSMEDEVSDSPAEHFEIENLAPKRPIITYEPARLRRKSKSFAPPKPKPKSKPMPQSSSFSRKTFSSKSSKKKRFLAMLRHQLTLNIDHEPQQYEEPRSLYEALKLMAKNKAPRVRFQESRNARRIRETKLRKPRRLKEVLYDVRYPIEAEVDSRYVHNIYTSPGESLRSLQVYGEDYLYKNQEDYENDSNTTDLCNRFSIASFFGDQSSNLRTKSSPVSVTRRTIGNRSTSPFSGRSSRF